MELLPILRPLKSMVVRLRTALRSMLKVLISHRTERQKRGSFGEKVTAKELEKKGYRIIRRNYRSSRNEIDLIARYGNALVFVEVKTRRRNAFFKARALSFPQEARIKKAAKAYLRENHLKHVKIYFLFALVISDDGKNYEFFLRPFRKKKFFGFNFR